MQKILIVGTSGCGKSTLALKLEKLLNIQNFDLDDYYWLPNWQPNPEYLNHVMGEILERNSWIISGNYSKFQPQLLQKADTIIWLDYAFMRCMYQGLKRSLRRIFFKKPCCNGNFETFKRTFLSSNSLLVWIISTYKRRKNFYSLLFKNTNARQQFLRFKNPKELNKWVNQLIKNF